MKKVEEVVQMGDNLLPKSVNASSLPTAHSITLLVKLSTAQIYEEAQSTG